MNEPTLRELLTEVADAVEPGDRLADIRARTRPSRSRLWVVPAGAGLVAASVVGAVALSGGPADRVAEPGPGSGTSSTSPSPTDPETTNPTPDEPSATETATPALPLRATAVYYVGDTPDGLRLYREFRRVPASDPLTAAVVGLAQAPQDPDYSSPWPSDAIAQVSFDGVGADGVLQVSLRDASLRGRPAGMTETEAGLAVEQVVRTLQAAVQARAAVQFRLDGNPVDQVLGVPASEPLAQGRDLGVLARVSISTPSEGQVVDNDGPLVVSGAGNSYEGNIVTELQALDGTVVVVPTPTIAGWQEDRLFPFEVTLDLSDVPPGEYVVRSQTDDPSGEQRFHVDNRTITVVD